MVDPRDLGLVTQVRSPHSEAPDDLPVRGRPRRRRAWPSGCWNRHDELVAGARASSSPAAAARPAARPAPGRGRRAARPTSTRRRLALRLLGELGAAGPPERPWPPRGAVRRGAGADRRGGALSDRDGACRPAPSRRASCGVPRDGERLARRRGNSRAANPRRRLACRGPRRRGAPGAERLAARRVGGEVAGRAGRATSSGSSRRPSPCRSSARASPACRASRRPTPGSSASTRRRPGSAPRPGRWHSSSASAGGSGIASGRSSSLCPDHADEPALLAALDAAIPPDAWLVTYNGRGFDWPLLVTRYRLARRGPPRCTRGMLDLLPHVRRLFRHRLGDARLATVERELLGVRRDGDVGGWEIPERYLAFVRGGSAGAARGRRHPQRGGRAVARAAARPPRPALRGSRIAARSPRRATSSRSPAATRASGATTRRSAASTRPTPAGGRRRTGRTRGHTAPRRPPRRPCRAIGSGPERARTLRRLGRPARGRRGLGGDRASRAGPGGRPRVGRGRQAPRARSSADPRGSPRRDRTRAERLRLRRSEPASDALSIRRRRSGRLDGHIAPGADGERGWRGGRRI